MTRWLLAAGGAAALVAPAAAQNTIDRAPGYLVIRVLLDGGAGGDPAAAPGGSTPGSEDGPGGGPPGGGRPGGPGGPPGPGGGPPGGPPPGGPAGGGGGARNNDATRSVVVVIPYKSIQRKVFDPNRGMNPSTNPYWPAIVQKYGTTFVSGDNTEIQLIPIRGLSLEGIVRQRHQEWASKQNYDGILMLITDALQVGLVDEAQKYFDEMVNLLEVIKKPNAPNSVIAAVKAYKTLKPDLDADVTVPDDAEEWRQKLAAAAVAPGKHYSLVHFGERQVSPEDLNRRLTILEQNLKAFYLWHAINGVALPVPKKRMTVILANRTTDMRPLRDALDGLPIQSDATFAPLNDVLVLSPERMDANGESFSRKAQGQYSVGWSKDDLIRGRSPKNRAPNEIARSMTLALVDKFLEEEADVAAVSREASRQLFVKSGLLPQNVRLPHWVESGVASFFQKPKGPVFTRPAGGNNNASSIMTVGLAAGYGSPNYVQHRTFKDLAVRGELNPDPAETLKNTLLDGYFDAARSGQDIDPPPVRPAAGGGAGGGPPAGAPGGGLAPAGRGAGGGGAVPPPRPGGGDGGVNPTGPGGPSVGDGPPPSENDPEIAARNSRERLTRKAEATAWALHYYLAKNKLPGLHTYYAELRRLPRDMRLNPDKTLFLFCQCFNLTNPERSAVDPAAFKKFAEGWIDTMKNIPPYGLDLPLDAATADPSSGGGVNGGGFNGGLGGQPGGGEGPGGGLNPGGRGGR